MKTTLYDHLGRHWYGGSRIMSVIQHLADATGKGPDDYLFIDPYSIGDCIHSLGLLPAFRAAYCKPGQRVIFMCNTWGGNLHTLMPFADHHVSSDLSSLGIALEYMASLTSFVTPQVPVVCPPDMHALGRFSRMGSNVIAVKKSVFGLRQEEAFSPPVTPVEVRERACQSMAAQGVVEGRSIIFCPHARSMIDMGPEFWSVVARLLAKVFPDLKMFTDVSTGAPLIPGTQPVTFAFVEAIAVMEFAGFGAVLRSGMADIVAFSKAHVYAVFPPVGHYTNVPPQVAREELLVSALFGPSATVVDIVIDQVDIAAAVSIFQRIRQDMEAAFA